MDGYTNFTNVYAEKIQGDSIAGTLTGNVTGQVTRILAKTNVTATDLTDNTETDTGITIPANAIVNNVYVRVNSAESTATTKTITVGTDSTDSGDADGYLASTSVAATGLHVCNEATITTGSSETYVSALGGALLGSGVVGTDTNGDFGIWQKEQDSASAGKNVTITFGDADGANELDLDIFVDYLILEAVPAE